MNNLMIADPTWLAIFLFGIGGIVSGIMMTGRDLNPIDRVMVSISSIQKWCGLGILLAAVFVLLGSPLATKAIQEAGQPLRAAELDAMGLQVEMLKAQAGELALKAGEWGVVAADAGANAADYAALAASTGDPTGAYTAVAAGYNQIAQQATAAAATLQASSDEAMLAYNGAVVSA